ncbi:MAG TPA: recombination regulator RecX [Gallionellaceae bacterium]|nr:recombination regulator RecX [Gallionellaceae bacterium]
MKGKTELSLRGRALQALARRELSRAELHAKLLPHITEAEDAGALLDDLEKRGWLSDARALDQTVRIRSARFGTQRIAHELRQKGISDELISAAIPQLKEGELEAARAVWHRKFANPPQDQKEKARQVRFLQSRGFSMDVIFSVMRINDESE